MSNSPPSPDSVEKANGAKTEAAGADNCDPLTGQYLALTKCPKDVSQTAPPEAVLLPGQNQGQSQVQLR